jgi:acyl-[acyl-carrier-protein] desaturase
MVKTGRKIEEDEPMRIESSILCELEEQRPQAPSGLLSRAEKDRLIERGVTALYRWYLARSQATRNWNPDRDFEWRKFSTHHSSEVNSILEGFYAVEQYVPDYVRKLLDVIRKSYGRAQFHVRWGAEEQRHMDAWRNTVMFSRFRSPQWIEAYSDRLRGAEWTLPWDDALHMIFYTVIQERATQINYMHMACIAAGRSGERGGVDDIDPVLERVSRTIAIDEAAHYNFFNDCGRLFFYYYPAEALSALVDVIRHFSMPGVTIIPDFANFEELVARAAIFGPREYATDVLQVVLKNLSVKAKSALVRGVRRSRQVPNPDGNMRDTALFQAIDYEELEGHVKRLYSKINRYERETGRASIDATIMVPSGLSLGPSAAG